MDPEQIQFLATNFWVCMLLVGVGIIGSFLKKLYDLQQTGTILMPNEFWRQQPYTVLLCWFSAYMLAVFWLFSGLLNAPLALLTGVACDYAFDTLRARAAGHMRTGQESGT
jgi:hypothetical protein